MNHFRSVMLLLVCSAAVSVAAWFAIGCLSTETFLPLGMKFAGVGEDIVRPIVERLYVALRVGLTVAPWLCLAAWFGIGWIIRHREQLDRDSVFIGAAIACALLALQNPVMPALPGLDNSWQWLLSKLAFANAIGRDVVFTYGPLGFLLYPQASMATVLASLVANLLHASLWTFALIALFRSSRVAHVPAWLLLATVLFPQMTMEWRWISLAVVLSAIPVVIPASRTRTTLLGCAGAVLAIACFMKFSSLVMVSATQVFCMGYIFVRERKLARTVAPWIASFVAASVVIACLNFDTFSHFARWISGSVQIASGYNKYMELDKSWLELAVPFLLLTALASLMFVRAGEKIRAAVFALLFSPLFFCSVKYALVRQNAYPFFYTVAVFSALVPCVSTSIRRRMAILFAALLLVSVGGQLPRAVAGDSYWHFAFGLNPLGLARTLMLPSTMRSVAEESEKRLAPHRLPEAWQRRIGVETVTFLPHEHAPAMGAQNFKLVPLWTFQQYSAYLPALDGDCARKLSGDGAPQWIVCDVDPVWSGHFINYPATWNAVFSNYACVAEEPKRLLLKKHPSRSMIDDKLNHATVRTHEFNAGEWIDCTAWSDSDITVDWPQTFVGRLGSLFFRNTLTRLSLRYADGHEATIALLPENLTSPFSLARVAVSSADFISVLKGGCSRRPVAIRFHANTSAFYSSIVIVREL